MELYPESERMSAASRIVSWEREEEREKKERVYRRGRRRQEAAID